MLKFYYTIIVRLFHVRTYFCRFQITKDPKILTEEDLHRIMISDTQTESEDVMKYELGGYMPINVGQVVGPRKEYQIVRKIGWGQFSTVWLTKHRLWYVTKI